MMFCWSDPLFRYLLEKVEKFPEVTFTETELRKTSSEEFEKLCKGKFLKYQQSDPEQETFPCPTPCDKGCDMVIGKIGESYQAICPEDSSITPILLKKQDLNRYIFDIDRLLAQIKDRNNLGGMTWKDTERLFFIGEKHVGQKRVAVMLGLMGNEKQAEGVLLRMQDRIPAHHDQTLVLLPFHYKIPLGLLATLERLNISTARFEEAFPKSDLKLDFTLLEKRKKPKEAPEYQPRTQKQLRDYDEYGYLCENRLWITGRVPKKRSNLVRVNDEEITVPDSEMLPLLCLVMELKKRGGGWVRKKKLFDEGITEEYVPYRLFNRLRNRLSPGLLGGDSENFIENNGKGSYRISTHPDFVIVEKKNWLVKRYNELKDAIKEQRKRREFQKKRWEEGTGKRGF